ncbi:GTPase-associated protein 1-related protein [Streptomyces sp. AN091965]|uniref:GTPase-associated protein 1-related protein n=1 Tax=Streptomyces sp. AN091965 TaxID=2927803 RepID=UPI001F605871|nr:GTPase-associated protein 1-related protein [Streptomyces sp. AN091965]MCI3933691.1 GTPase-associated protein 1-related protein [Streptomyces sp. AN091965]
MAIRRHSYRLAEEPVTGAVRLIPVPASAPPSPLSAHADGAEREDQRQLREWAELAFGTGHTRGRGHSGDGTGLSYSRLPDGGSLLCATATGGDVAAYHLSEADTLARFAEEWPITWWEAGEACEAGKAAADHAPAAVGHDELVAFARAHETRVAPFLADVRRLFDDPAGRQLVVAEERPGAVARWIALACASLPAAYVPSLTFTTGAADPGRAPQHIVGIGPDADFDRGDPTVLDHLYRVHDGLGGPGSPPRADTWATWTARLWLAGEPLPEAAADGDPFAPGPLVPPLLRAGLLTGRELTGLVGDVLRTAVATLVASVADTRTDPAGLLAVCRELHAHDPAAAAPLALALARHRLGAARPEELPGELTAVCAEVPLGAEAERALRGEYGGDADKELRRALRDPVGTWAEPLRIALAVGADDGRGIGEAIEKLARALRDPTGVERGPAVRVLDDVGSEPLTRRVLRRLADTPHTRRLDLLVELADSPYGDWLRRSLDEGSPLPLRLAEAAARWRAGGAGLRGMELFAKLTEVLPRRRVTDADTLQQMWWLVWGSSCPAPAELSWVAHTCTMRLLVAAGYGLRMTGLLAAPDGVDRELVGFAADLLHETQLPRRDRATAELLVVAQDLADGRKALRQGLRRFEALCVDAGPLGSTVRRGVFRLVALALARADADQLARPPAFDQLVAAGPELLDPYRAFMLDEDRRDRLERELPLRPAEVAAYYYLWRPRRRRGISHDWQRVAAELLDEVLGPVAVRLDDRRLSQVADAMLDRQGIDRVREWTAWRNSFRAR